jgi:hypothetical protein
MKNLIRVSVAGLLAASFVFGIMATTTQAKPMLGCDIMCNRTTYQIVECCPFIQKGEIVWRCHNTGEWCFPVEE